MSERLLRINESIREVLGETISDLNDPRIGFVTITNVRTARDLKNAKVFFSVLGDQDVRDSTLRALRSSHGMLQREVARQVKLRSTPQLHFEYDDTLDTAIRIQELLSDNPVTPETE